jgi:hypothetical protein
MGSREPLRMNERSVVVCTSPDVCLKDGAKVPYDVYSLGRDDVRASTDVQFTKVPAGHAGSRLAMTYGDQPADGGIKSGSVGGYTRPADDLATRVRVNGFLLARHDSVFEMNCPDPASLFNTKGRLIYPGPAKQPLPRNAEDRRRLATLEKLKDRFDGDDFYSAMAEFDPANADFWNEMVNVQARFKGGELAGVYDAATVTYSQSMRQTLHGTVINLFEDGAGLSRMMAKGPEAIRDWYIEMHATAFDNNGAWNPDSLTERGKVMAFTSPTMLRHGVTLARAMKREAEGHEDPYARDAVERVREQRRRAGLPTSRLPNDRAPSVMDGYGGE